jgi:hypothetical protein
MELGWRLTMAKKSSSAMSSIAAKVLRAKLATGDAVDRDSYNALLADAKALAGSVLSQDETKGQDDA